MTTIARLLVELGLDATGFEQGVAAAQAKTQALGSTLSGFGKNMTVGVTAPLTGIGAVALMAAGRFEQSMNQMAVVSGATAQQMAAMQEEALHLGAVTTFSASEAADAMLELAKAGLTPQETLAATSGVLDLAAAGSLALADAAEVAANAVNAFNLPAEATSNVANLLAAAANASSVEVADLSMSFKMASSVFAANGQSVEDLTAALALLGNNALKGSDAGTSLKTMLMRLTAPTDEAAAVLNSLGVQVYAADGSMRGFAAILADLERGTAGLTDAQRNAALSTLFGADAIRAVTILLKEGTTGFDTMSQAVGKQGAAADVANARMAGLAGAVQYFKGSVESTLIAAVLPFTGALSGLIRFTADLIARFGALPAPVQQAAVAFAAVAAAVGPVALALGTVISLAGAALAPVLLLTAGVAALAAVFVADFGGIRTAATETWAALTNLWSVVAAAGPASSAAAAAVSLFPVALQPVVGAALNAVAAVQAFAASVGGVQGVMAAAAAQTGATLAGLWAQVTAGFAQLAARLEPGLARLGAAFVAMQGQMAQLAPAFAQVVAAAQNLWAALAPILAAVGQAFGAAFAVTAVAAVNGLAAAAQRLAPIMGAVAAQIAASMNFVATTLTNTTALVKALVTGDWAAAWQAAQGLVQGTVDYIAATLDNLLTVVGEVWGGIRDTVTGTLRDVGVDIESVLSRMQRTWEGAFDAMRDAVRPVVEVVEGFRARLADFESWLSGLNFPNPFAGWQMPTLPSLPNPFGGDSAPTPGQNAQGTNFWRGGWSWVGEQGPELVNLPRGSQVFPADVSRRMAADAAGAGPTVNVFATVASGIDVHQLAYQVAAEIGRWRR